MVAPLRPNKKVAEAHDKVMGTDKQLQQGKAKKPSKYAQEAWDCETHDLRRGGYG